MSARAAATTPPRSTASESIPDTKQLNLFGSGRYQINADWQAYLTGLYSKQETQFHDPADAAVGPDLHDGDAQRRRQHHPAADERRSTRRSSRPAHGVDGQPLNVRYRCVVCGNRDTTDTNEAWQIVAGAKGTAWNWDFDGSFNYSENTTKEKPNGGFFQYTQIVPLLNSGTRQPVRPQHGRRRSSRSTR